MEKEKLLKELKQKFEKTKKELGFKATFEEIDDIFFIKDLILEKNYVSEEFSRQLCSRMADTLNNWLMYLHSIIYPSGTIINSIEQNAFNNEEIEEMKTIIKKIMYLIRKNSLAGVKKDNLLEKEFIDETLDEWNNNLKKKLTKILTKVDKKWKEETNKIEEKEDNYFG